MAQAFLDDDETRQQRRPDDQEPPPQYEAPPSPPQQSQQNSPFNINDDLSRVGGGVAIEAEDRAKLERLARESSQNENYDSYLKEIQAKQQRRAAPTFSAGGTGGDADQDGDGRLDPAFAQRMAMAQTAGRRMPFPSYNTQPDQFDDPYTQQLEALIKQQIASIQQPQANPALDNLLAYLNQQFSTLSGPRPAIPEQQRLLDFTNQQFGELSAHPGYSPAEMGLLRTQALEPIEIDRASAQRRSNERTAARGFLPSSGLAEVDSREVDKFYDQQRIAAQRDLGVNAVRERDEDVARAMQFGQAGSAIQNQIQRENDQRRAEAMTIGQLSGVTLPNLMEADAARRRNESIALSSLLYQLPRNAQMDALSVLGVTPAPQDIFGNAFNLLQAQENQRRYNQQQNDQFWAQIGDVLAGLFG